MSVTKYNHEFESIDGRRKLDPIGRLSFNHQMVATKSGNVHTIDLEKSSNFLVKIEDEDSWIKFINYDSSSIHRFDIIIEITGPVIVNTIKFGDGTNEYHKMQFDVMDAENTILPYIVWPYEIPLREKNKVQGDIGILTCRFGKEFFIEGELQPAFIMVNYKWTRIDEMNIFNLTVRKGLNIPAHCMLIWVDGELKDHNETIQNIVPNTEINIMVSVDACVGDPMFNNIEFTYWSANLSDPSKKSLVFDNDPESMANSFNMPFANVELIANYVNP